MFPGGVLSAATNCDCVRCATDTNIWPWLVCLSSGQSTGKIVVYSYSSERDMRDINTIQEPYLPTTPSPPKYSIIFSKYDHKAFISA